MEVQVSSTNNGMCDPPIHRYRMFGHPGERRITCVCGRTKVKFRITKDNGEPYTVELNVGEALEHGALKLANSAESS